MLFLPRRGLLVAGAVENIIRRALRLGRRVNQKSAIIAKLLQPTIEVGGLILEDRVGDSGFGAKISRSHFGNEFLSTVRLRAERGGFYDRFASEALLTPCRMHGLVQGCGVKFFGAHEKLSPRQSYSIGDRTVERFW